MSTATIAGLTAVAAVDLDDTALAEVTDKNGLSRKMTLAQLRLALPTLGLKFPATQVPSADANTLDDYEEGTWTPTDASGAALAFTSTAGNCHYVKIGQLVLASFMVVFPATASGAAVSIGGLPFTTLTTTNSIFGGGLSFSNYAAAAYLQAVSNGTTFGINTTAGVAVTNANMSTNQTRGYLIYRASA